MFRRNIAKARQVAVEKTKFQGWVLPKQESTWAPPGSWSNRDLDITPAEWRTWTWVTIFGYWISDVISVQSWETGSSILALGLTWREAVFGIIFGSFVMSLPMTLNGYTGARTHAPFPILARGSFGFYLAQFPVVVRLITCLFWSAITNYLGVPAATQCIRAIWPQFRNMPNHIPASVGITTQEMVSYLVFWVVQFPLLLIPPHRLRWVFLLKVVMTTATIVGMAIWTVTRAGSTGNIWQQTATVSGSTKAWLVMWTLNSCTASWSTVGVNIPDFTRYMRSPNASLTQCLWFTATCSWVAVMGIVVTSASYGVFGEYVWNPISIIDTWDGPAGRAAAFFAGFSWCLAQMCTNLSATIVSGANDLTSLFPKYCNIRRGTIFITVVGGWAMVPWKILHSAGSLLNFLNSLGIFLAPIMGIQIADYHLIKRGHVDLPALYDPHGRYRYWHGINWRALVALLCAIGPALPGLVHAVNPSLPIGSGMENLTNFNWYYGIFTAGTVHTALSWLFPAQESLVPHMVEERENPAEFADGEKEPRVSGREV